MHGHVYNGIERIDNIEDNQCGVRIDQAFVDVHGIWTCVIYNQQRQAFNGSKQVVVTGKTKITHIDDNDAKSIYFQHIKINLIML